MIMAVSACLAGSPPAWSEEGEELPGAAAPGPVCPGPTIGPVMPPALPPRLARAERPAHLQPQGLRNIIHYLV